MNPSLSSTVRVALAVPFAALAVVCLWIVDVLAPEAINGR